MRGRWVGVAQCAIGSGLLLRPTTVARAAGGTRRPTPPEWLVRVLGARSVVQGVATALAPHAPVLVGGAAVDAMHALSMLPVVIASRKYRRAAAVSGAVAVASAALGMAAAERCPDDSERTLG